MTTTFSVLLTKEVPADDCPVDHPDHHGEWSYSSSTQLGESREFMEVDNRILKLSYHFLSHFPLIPTLSEHGLQIGNFRYFQHWNHLKSFVQFAEPIWNPKFGCPRSTSAWCSSSENCISPFCQIEILQSQAAPNRHTLTHWSGCFRIACARSLCLAVPGFSLQLGQRSELFRNFNA